MSIKFEVSGKGAGRIEDRTKVKSVDIREENKHKDSNCGQE